MQRFVQVTQTAWSWAHRWIKMYTVPACHLCDCLHSCDWWLTGKTAYCLISHISIHISTYSHDWDVMSYCHLVKWEVSSCKWLQRNISLSYKSSLIVQWFRALVTGNALIIIKMLLAETSASCRSRLRALVQTQIGWKPDVCSSM